MTTPTIPTVHEPVKEVVQVGPEDFDCYLDGRYVRSTRTEAIGKTYLDNYVYDLITHNSYYPVEGYVACLVDTWPEPEPSQATLKPTPMPVNVAAEVPTKVQVIYKSVVQSTVTYLQLLHSNDLLLQGGLDRALKYMPNAAWTYDAQSRVLAITSNSQPRVVHFASVDQCDCPTTKGVCWHRASALICSTLAGGGIYPLAPLPLPEISIEDSNGDDMTACDQDARGGK